MKKSANILLIEPDKVLAEIYKSVLMKNHYKVVTVHDAQVGINAVDELVPDLIILELQLAKHSGIEFLYELRSYKEWHNIPVIILSMVDQSEFKNSNNILFNNLGILNYYYKLDVSMDNLLDIVSNSLV